MPLTFATIGEEYIIKRVGGKPAMKQHLSDLGFVPGGTVVVVSKNGENLIVRVKDSRLAIDESLALKVEI